MKRGPWRRPRRRAERPGEAHPHGAGWLVRCRAIRRRDGKVCRYCGGVAAGARGAIDHLLPRRLFPRGQGDFPENLALLCLDHHAIKTSMIEPALYEADYLTFHRFLLTVRETGPIPRADQIGAALGRLRALLGAA